MFQIPFRWNLTHRNHLGSLVGGEQAESYPAFLDHLLPCCSRVLAFGGDFDLIFVGRSPESIFDHLSGLLFDSSWFERLELLHFSMRFREEAAVSQEHPESVNSMRGYMQHLGLHPEGIATRIRPVAFIDLVATGETFGRLVTFLRNWSASIEYDWNAVKRRIRLIGITEKTKPSPKTWRWQQQASWVPLLESGSVKNVSIPRALWEYLGNYQHKVSRSYTPARWGDPEHCVPSYSESQIKALRLAYELFELGRTKERRERFVSLLVKEPAMKHDWFRMLVQEIR
ncbi:MAG TPA: hypothetical protein VMZ30_03995 [Pyrinomonadaceae bacterium]|nr:hypothetical protein [Pyrinomonadaceae bacterium]